MEVLKNNKGVIITYVLVFGAIFLILLGGLLGFILLQLRQSAQKVAWNHSLHIAEAGINYYRWCLNNEVEQNCQTERDYFDPTGNLIGHFSLETTSQESCGQTIQRRIASTGWTNNFPNIKRKISVLYARESVAKYSYIINENLWVGSDHEIRGPFHTNGGIRFDGENQSLVTSARDTWLCTSSFACNYLVCPSGCSREGSACRCPGVFTTTGVSRPDLFNFPVTPFDFTGITIDLAQMKKITKDEGRGLYFEPSGAEGYRIAIDGDNLKVWKVLSTTMLDKICTVVGSKVICDGGTCEPECSHCQFDKCVVRDPVIKTETGPIYDGPIPQDCGLIFFEDELWIGKADLESNIKGKITIVSANLINPNKTTNVWLQGNINYARDSQLDGLLLIAQRNNLIGLYSPDKMELKGIFIAQTGFFGRNHYPCAKYSPYCKREKLEIYGSIVSNGRVGTQWISGSQIVSGYLKRESYFDANLVYSPPVFTPSISYDFKLVGWEEIR